MNEVAATQSSLSILILFLSLLSPPLLTGTESEQVLNMVLCVYIHMQVSANMSVCVGTLNTTTTTCEPLTVFIMNNLAFCQLALKSEPAGSLF